MTADVIQLDEHRRTERRQKGDWSCEVCGGVDVVMYVRANDGAVLCRWCADDDDPPPTRPAA